MEKRSDLWHEQNQSGNAYEVIGSDNFGWNGILAVHLDSVVTRQTPIVRYNEYVPQQGTKRCILHSALQFPSIA